MPPTTLPQHSSRQAHAPHRGGGCLSGFLIPPLLILAGVVMVLSSLAAAPGRPRPGALHRSTLSPIFTPSVRAWGAELAEWSASSEIDPNLAAVVMQIESCGDPGVSSPAGASGLFQVMPFHFRSGENPLDPGTNALRGLDYLKKSLAAAGGDARLALAGYNGGIGILSRDESAWPHESVRYSSWGAAIYADVQAGLEHSPALEDWLSAGGAHLCRQAEETLGIR